jgi:hypothetical protein
MLCVSVDLLMGRPTQGQLDLPVAQHASDAKLRRLSALQAVRLARWQEPQEAPLDDDEDAQARLFAPRFARDPFVQLELADVREHLAHLHRAGEAARVVDEHADRHAVADLELASLFCERHQELFGQTPVHERADGRQRSHLEECDIFGFEIGLAGLVHG